MVFVITLLVFLILVVILLWVKRQRYFMMQADVIALLQNVLVGQAGENEWAVFLSTSFQHCPALGPIRDACMDIDEKEYLGHSRSGFLLSKSGLEQLRTVLAQVEALDIDSGKN